MINGQIISTKHNDETDIVKFEELNIDLSELNSFTIKKPKVQETNTLALLNCFKKGSNLILKYCREDFKKELYPVLNRRLVLPFYIPIISLLCSFLLIKSKNKYFNKFSIFCYCFLILLFAELSVRYTGLSSSIRISFFILPIVLTLVFYSLLTYRFSKEFKTK